MTPRPLFVYGSLRRGCSNHHELGSSVFLGVARTACEYALVSVGEFPALVRGQESVPGELYAVDEAAFAALDAFEGDDYVRMPIALSNGTSALAYVLETKRAEERPWART